ncbi:MAG TPA: hypothetical protein VFB14_25025 [Bryobacteraceae bacterium]|nr:hypothetical protein [Bryobacteraceae bacterium]
MKIGFGGSSSGKIEEKLAGLSAYRAIFIRRTSDSGSSRLPFFQALSLLPSDQIKQWLIAFHVPVRRTPQSCHFWVVLLNKILSRIGCEFNQEVNGYMATHPHAVFSLKSRPPARHWQAQ